MLVKILQRLIRSFEMCKQFSQLQWTTKCRLRYLAKKHFKTVSETGVKSDLAFCLPIEKTTSDGIASCFKSPLFCRHHGYQSGYFCVRKAASFLKERWHAARASINPCDKHLNKRTSYWCKRGDENMSNVTITHFSTSIPLAKFRSLLKVTVGFYVVCCLWQIVPLLR